MTPDINVLVAASRSDHPHHRLAKAWLELALADCANGQSLRLLPLVVAGFLRIVTHPKIYAQPMPTPMAIDFLDAMFRIPGVDMPVLGSEWPILRQLCLDGDLSANQLPDAWLAAAVIELGEHLVTFDKGFKHLLKRSQVTILAVH